MKYNKEDYINCGFYSGDEEIKHHKEKIVKCRKSHKCAACESEIAKGDYALRETGFMDEQPTSCYTCIPCLDKWLDEINYKDEEGEEN